MKTTNKTTIWTLMLMLLAACSQSEVVTTYEQEAVKGVDIPVAFNTYFGEEAQTRAVTTLDVLKGTSENPGPGFGVFAFYTEGGTYEAKKANTYPNFMYNQHVYWHDNTYWKYTPLKYWPNDFSTGDVGTAPTDSNKATGSKTSGVSFFAYAPYVKCNPSTGQALNADDTSKTTGIVGFKTNAAKGDPKIHYLLGGTEDLLWGQEKYSDDNGDDRYRPLTDRNKRDGEQVFTFRHALSGLTFSVGAYFDEGTSTNLSDGTWRPSNTIADGTYITIESVDVSSANLPYEGWFNLNDGTWSEQTLSTVENPASLKTITTDEISSHLKYRFNATVEKPTVEKVEVSPGVGRKARNSEGEALADDPGATYPLTDGGFFVLTMPNESTPITLDITCNYHVWTFDPRNADGISKVENNVTNSVSLSVEKGIVYGIVMRLGMTSVKLDVIQYSSSSGSGDANPEIWPGSSSLTSWDLPL